MVTKEQRNKIEDACKALYAGEDYKGLYLHINHILRNYSTLLAEHNPAFGDIPDGEASQDVYTLNTLVSSIEPLIQEDLLNC